ncbi:MAG: ATP-binding cassette domain-containing protein, partial [Acidobacteria bacterium]|nr:ATP-binding cassette domain-containing protein [Acidobacteriota bacterium]
MKKAILVECSQIEKNFGVKKALNKVNLKLLCGEIFLLLGENGAGKSTFMKILGGIVHPDEGTIRVEGKEI